MRIAAVQSESDFGVVARNLERAAALVDTAAAQVHVPSELFATGDFNRDRAEARRYAEVLYKQLVA